MRGGISKKVLACVTAGMAVLIAGCAVAPEARSPNIPSPTMADQRRQAINERPDSVMYLPLGEDVLVPEIIDDGEFPQEFVGPFELRGETLAGALQLILADYDISLAFETEEGLNRRITVANLRGDLGKVVNQVCSLANLYCSYEHGGVTVKDTQTFTVTLPPIGSDADSTDYLDNVAAGLAAILGTQALAPIVDSTTRTIVYNATQRTADIASRYFQRLRANTALIVFETYIWEVSLDSGNSMGVNWDQIQAFGKFNTSFGVTDAVAADFTNPISIGLPTTQDIAGTPSKLIEFLSQFGAVKTISQPQITVLSGAAAELRVADTENYVSEITTTLSGDQSTTSVSTDSVDTGFTLTINSSWDKATVYANVNVSLTDVKQIDDFAFSDGGPDGGSTAIQLPQTSEREVTTQIRVRPGDSILIAGLVRENDSLNSRGPGLMEPILPTSRTARAGNLELVILLRPRVVIYTAVNDRRYVDYVNKKHQGPTPVATSADNAPSYENVGRSSAAMDVGAAALTAAPARSVETDETPDILTPSPTTAPVPASSSPATPEPVVLPVENEGLSTSDPAIFESPPVQDEHSSGYVSRYTAPPAPTSVEPTFIEPAPMPLEPLPAPENTSYSPPPMDDSVVVYPDFSSGAMPQPAVPDYSAATAIAPRRSIYEEYENLRP